MTSSSTGNHCESLSATVSLRIHNRLHVIFKVLSSDEMRHFLEMQQSYKTGLVLFNASTSLHSLFSHFTDAAHFQDPEQSIHRGHASQQATTHFSCFLSAYLLLHRGREAGSSTAHNMQAHAGVECKPASPALSAPITVRSAVALSAG